MHASLRTVPFLLALALLAVPQRGEAQPGGTAVRPNILWISVEDMSPHLGAYGDPHAHTPAIDRLAAEGVRYTNAFAVAGVCAPSRSGIITGVYPTSLGTHHMRSTGWLPDEVKPFPAYLRQAGYYTTNNSKTDYNFDPPDGIWDESSNRAHWRNRPDARRPFFAVFNFTTTHESRIESDALYEQAVADVPEALRADPAELVLPPYYPDTPSVRADWARYYDTIAAMDRQVAEVLKQLEEDGLAEETIVFFWSDHGVGLPRAKRWLYDSGTRVPLIVRIPEALRAPGQGRPGTVEEELVSLLDLAPTVLHLSGVEVPGHLQGRAFLGRDLSAPRDYVYGARDRMDERYDIIRMVRDRRFKYLRNYEPFKPYYQYMNTPEKGRLMRELRRVHAAGRLRPAAAGFMAETKPVEELYDTEADPHEVRNLAGDPAYRDVLERMRAAHLAWVEKTGDVGLIPEPVLHELQAAHAAPIYTVVRAGRGLPIARIRDVAGLWQEGPAAVPALTRHLAGEDAAVRYWAATGLGLLGAGAASARPALEQALDDSSAVVRIAAAHALGRMGATSRALPALRAALRSEGEWVRLHAAIALDLMGEQARPALEALQGVMDDDNKYVVRVANHAINGLLGTHHAVP